MTVKQLIILTSIITIGWLFDGSLAQLGSLLATKSPWGIYTATSLSGGILYEMRGNGRDAAATSVLSSSGSGYGASVSIPYIYGSTTSTIVWPSGSIPTSFTICSLTRYTGGTRGRILSSPNGNWLHGHWAGNRGNAFYEGWKTVLTNVNDLDNWLVFCGKNSESTPNNILLDGSGIGTTSGGTGGKILSINNNGWGELSDWAFSYLFIWDQILTDSEMQIVSTSLTQYLSNGQLLTLQPSQIPTRFPTSRPSTQPSRQPSSQPSQQPSQPTSQPTKQPSLQPSKQPSQQPSQQPYAIPTSQPSFRPNTHPTSQPSIQPSSQPTIQPVGHPSAQPTSQPTVRPSSQPSLAPSSQPSLQPFEAPTSQPSQQPSLQPTSQPLTYPSSQPSIQPSDQPSRQPTTIPSSRPTGQPSHQPSTEPSSQPSYQPTASPTTQPTMQPSSEPSSQPTSRPTMQPTGSPTGMPSSQPSSQPFTRPTTQPTTIPSSQPSSLPSQYPTVQPTVSPSSQPSSQPTMEPTGSPSSQPSRQPTSQPSISPLGQPSYQPTSVPSRRPSVSPSTSPSVQPTIKPTSQPSLTPFGLPSCQPSSSPTVFPTNQPTTRPSAQPTSCPSQQPSCQPTCFPSGVPTGCPTAQPTTSPSSWPSMQPSHQPSSQPTVSPSLQPSASPTTFLASMDSFSAKWSETGSSLLLAAIANNTSSTNGLFTVTAELTQSISQSLLPFLYASLNSTNMSAGFMHSVTFSANGVSITVSLISAQNLNSSSSDMVPGSSISLSSLSASNPDALGFLVSVVEISSSVFENISISGLGSTAGLSPSQLSSGIITLALSAVLKSGAVSEVAVPSFDTALSLSNKAMSTVNSSNIVLRHNCTQGIQETVSLFCTESRIMMNMTCTGAVSASLSRQCPVPKHVCNVLNLVDNSVASSDFCRAVEVGTKVICKCGLDQLPSNTNVSQSLLALQGRISVAAFSSFAAGEFDSSVSAVVMPLSGNVAQQSMLLFVTFVLLWGLGVTQIGIYYVNLPSIVPHWFRDRYLRQKMSAKNVQRKMDLVDNASLRRTSQVEVSSLHRYLITICPGMVVSEAWWDTLKSYLLTKHIYFRVFRHYFQSHAIVDTVVPPIAVSDDINGSNTRIVGDAMHSPTTINNMADKNYRHHQLQQEEKERRKMTMEIIMALTSLTVSCFVLSLLYDFQYPAEDGYCQKQTTEATCLYRKSLIDPWHNRCTWSPPQNDEVIAAIVQESKFGAVLQETVLRSSTSGTNDASSTDQVYCHLNADNNSLVALMFSFIITSVFVGFTDVMLEHCFTVLNAQIVPWRVSLSDYHNSRQEEDLSPIHLPETVLSQRHVWYSTFQTRMYSLRNNTHLNNHTIKSEQEQHMRDPSHSHTISQAESVTVLPIRRRADVSLLSRTNNHLLHDNGNANLPTAVSKLAQSPMLLHVSQRAISGAEYGVGLLHMLLAEMIHYASHSHAKYTIFLRAMEDFFEPVYYTYAIHQYTYFMLLLCVNCGAFYFIITKTVARGYAWQWSFFQALMLEWIAEIFFIELMEIVVLDIWLPGSVYAEAKVAAMMVLQTATMVSLVEHDLCATDMQTITQKAVEREDDKEALTAGFTSLSLRLAEKRPDLLESKVVKLCRPLLFHAHTALQQATHVSRSTWCLNTHRDRSAKKRDAWSLLWFIAWCSPSTLRTITNIIGTLCVAVSVFVYISLHTLPAVYSWTAMVFVLGVVSMSCVALYVSVTKTRHRLKTEILPVMPSDADACVVSTSGVGDIDIDSNVSIESDVLASPNVGSPPRSPPRSFVLESKIDDNKERPVATPGHSAISNNGSNSMMTFSFSFSDNSFDFSSLALSSQEVSEEASSSLGTSTSIASDGNR